MKSASSLRVPVERGDLEWGRNGTGADTQGPSRPMALVVGVPGKSERGYRPVEDDPTRRWGVHCAETGAEAISMLVSEHYDLVVTDAGVAFPERGQLLLTAKGAGVAVVDEASHSGPATWTDSVLDRLLETQLRPGGRRPIEPGSFEALDDAALWVGHFLRQDLEEPGLAHDILNVGSIVRSMRLLVARSSAMALELRCDGPPVWAAAHWGAGPLRRLLLGCVTHVRARGAALCRVMLRDTDLGVAEIVVHAQSAWDLRCSVDTERLAAAAAAAAAAVKVEESTMVIRLTRCERPKTAPFRVSRPTLVLAPSATRANRIRLACALARRGEVVELGRTERAASLASGRGVLWIVDADAARDDAEILAFLQNRRALRNPGWVLGVSFCSAPSDGGEALARGEFDDFVELTGPAALAAFLEDYPL